MSKCRGLSWTLVMVFWIVSGVDMSAATARLALNVHMIQHAPKSLMDWLNRPEILSVDLDNKQDSLSSIKIRTIIKQNTHLVAYTRYNDLPLINVRLGSTTFTAGSLLSSDNIEYLDGIGRGIYRNGTLSPGMYSICCQVLDPSNPDSVLCTSEVCPFSVSGYEAVQLMEPINFRWVQGDKPLMFKWKAISPSPQVPRIVRYKFLLFECSKGMDPEYVMETMEPIYEKFSDNVSPLSLVIPLNKMNVRKDRQYVWTVQALDQDSEPYSDPDGMAEPFVLRIK